MKAVAVPYIIAILLGVAVIGVVGFWFVSSGGKLSSQSSGLECDTQRLIFCENGQWDDKCGDKMPDCSQILGTGSSGRASPTPASSGPTFEEIGGLEPPRPGVQ